MQKIRFGSQADLKAASLALRYEVFVIEQGITPHDEFDNKDDEGRQYFVVFDDQLPIGTIRYQSIDRQTIQPDRFCVKLAYRKLGIGTKLITAYEEQAKNDGYSSAQLVAEVTAQGFYEKLGYRIISEPFVEDGILCVLMKKLL